MPRVRDADDEVVAAGTKRGDHFLNGVRIVGAVAIHEHQDICIAGNLSAGQAGAPVARAHGDDFGTDAARYLWRSVGRAAIGDYDVVNDIARQCRDDRANDLASFSVGITTTTFRSPAIFALQRLQRKPQFAHVVGGFSD